MDYRTGMCSQCGAEYKVPASFAHDVARCKVCGGVVHLSARPGATPAASAAPASRPVPARKVAPKPEAPAPAPAPAAASASVPPAKPAPEPGRPSMLERLKAERAAQAARAAGAAPRAEPRPAPSTPAARPTPSGASGRPPRPAAAGAARTAGATRPGGARRSARAAGADGETPARGSRRGATKGADRRKSLLLPLVGLGAVVLIGAGVFFFKDALFGGGSPDGVEAATHDDDALATDAAAEGAGNAAGAESATDPAVDGPVGNPVGSTGEQAAENVDASGSAGEADEAAAAPEERPAEAAAALSPEDVAAEAQARADAIDLGAIPDFGPVDGTTEEQWREMTEWATLWMDPGSGAKGTRSRDKLVAQGRRAFPVILNAMKDLDVGTEDGRRNGDLCQRELQKLCNGNNFDWKYSTEPADVYFNKKVIQLWCNQWDRAEDDIEYWIKMAKLDEKAPEEAKRLREELAGGAAAPGEEASDPADDGLDVD